MKEKIEILQRLIESRMFASSPAALAKVLGYKGKMTLYRLVEGKISSRTVDEIWGRLQTIFETTDSDLSLLKDVCELSIFLQQEILSEIERLEPKSMEQMIKSFIEEKYNYSERFDKEVVPFLKDLRKDKPDHYWGMLLYLYLKIKKVDLYQKNFKQVWLNWLDDLGGIFFTLYPENIEAQGAIAGMKATMLHESFIPSMWWLLYSGIVLCRIYTEQDYMRILAASSHLIDCPSFSYWIPLGAEYKEGERAWIWIQNDFNTAFNGCYSVYQIRAGNNIETFYVEKFYTFRFVGGSEQDYLQIVDMKKGASDYDCEYDSDKSVLHIIPCSETQEMLLPAFIRCINTSHSYGKDEKVWNRLLDKFMDGKGGEMLQEVAGAVGQTDIYEVEDVIISRKFLCLILTESGFPKKYQLPLTAYSFLTTITPMQEIWISRHVDDSEIYIEWPSLGYAIKLSDFTQIEYQ